MASTQVRKLAHKYEVTNGRKFDLDDVDPEDTSGLALKDEADALLDESVRLMALWQEKLYAQDRRGVLLIFQALDAAGKDSTIKHVMSGLNPQGCEVHSFKSPSPEELDHDFLWRTNRLLPRRGNIGIFNRSYYEEVLIVRVHPEILSSQHLPLELVTKDIWDERYEDINHFERYVARQGFAIRKFFLHVSKDEQKKRFLKRLDEPEKNWKFSVQDAHERQHYADYMRAYERAIRATATRWAPWYVIPADNKWFARLVVASAVIQTLESLDPKFPTIDDKKRRELDVVRKMLINEDSKESKSGKKAGKRKKDKKEQAQKAKKAKKGAKNQKKDTEDAKKRAPAA